MRPQPKRLFQDQVATRDQVPLRIAFVGPSGSGKTYSAFRLAQGIAEVDPGEIWFINTEGKRGTAYASFFQYRIVNLDPPFNPLAYRDAIEHCLAKGAKVIIVDSMTHEHTGTGGVLEMHERAVDRLSNNSTNRKIRGRYNALAWQEPKAERSTLLELIARCPAHILLCFRAKEKTKPAKRKAGADDDESEGMVAMGWMPLGGEDFVYEMDLSMILLPGADGLPTFTPDRPGERVMCKLPIQFRPLFRDLRPIDEKHGRDLALWARGDAAPKQLTGPAPVSRGTPPAAKTDPIKDRARAEARKGRAAFTKWWNGLNDRDADAVSSIEEEIVAIFAELEKVPA